MENIVDESTAEPVLEINNQQVINEISADMDGIEENKKQQEEICNAQSEPSCSSVDTSVNPQNVNVDRHNITMDNQKSSNEYTNARKDLLKDDRYFVVKTNNNIRIELAKLNNCWSIEDENKNKFDEAFRTCKKLIIIFSLQESSKFAGFARISGLPQSNPSPLYSSRRLDDSNMYKIEWISKQELHYRDASHLYNSYDGKPVTIAENGQEIDQNTGMRLCSMFPEDEPIDYQTFLYRLIPNQQQNIRPRNLEERRRERYRLYYRFPYPRTLRHRYRNLTFQYDIVRSAMIRRYSGGIPHYYRRLSIIVRLVNPNRRPIGRNGSVSLDHNYHSIVREILGSRSNNRQPGNRSNNTQ